MYYSTQPAIRGQFITGLRELAAYLDSHPAMPVPLNGTDITLHTDHTEDGGRGQVVHIAAMLSAAITDDTRNGGHLTATRMFGPIGYTVVSIPATVMAAHHAYSTYSGCVTPGHVMNDKLVIWLDDEYALYACALHDNRNPAVAWLDAQFTYRWATLAYLDDHDPVPGPYCIRPMAELIDPLADALEDPNASMDIRQSDYDDPGRWWL